MKTASCEAPPKRSGAGYPFGETRFTTGTMFTDKLFTGQRQMAGLGIYHYGARFYSPKLGRFLSADTITPDPANPQNLNRYSYVTNNPIRYIDPTGHRQCEEYAGTCMSENQVTQIWNHPQHSQHPRPHHPHHGGHGGGNTTPTSTPAPSTTPIPPPTAPVVPAPAATPFPSYTSGYTNTTVTNSLGGAITQPSYVGLGATLNIPIPYVGIPQIYTGPDPDELEPTIPTSIEIILPSTIMQVPPEYEIVVNTTITTTTVTFDQNGRPMDVSVDVQTSSELLTPYWQDRGNTIYAPYQ